MAVDIVNVGKRAMDVRKGVTLTPYSKVIINVAKGNNSDEVISYVAGNDSGTPLEFDCPWGSQKMANDLLAKINGYQYQPYTATGALPDPVAEMGDGVQINGIYGGIYQQDALFTHTFYSDFAAPQDEQLDHEFTYETPVERRLKRQEAFTKSTFQIQHDNIEAKVSKKGGYAEDNSFSWKLLSDEFGLYSGRAKVFTCNKNGIIVKGTVYADAGLIGAKYNSSTNEWEGGFSIQEKKMFSGKSSIGASSANQTEGVYIGTDGIALGKVTYDNINYDAFSVTKAGVFTARKGYIGNASSGFEISNKNIHNGTDSLSSTEAGVYIGTDGVRGYYDATHNFTFGKSTSSFKLMGGKSGIGNASANQTTGVYIGTDGIALGRSTSGNSYVDAFSVSSNGTFTARTGYIGNGSNGFTVNATSIYNGTDSMTSTTQGIFLGTQGVRVCDDASNSFTFNKNGTLEIKKGMTSFSDTTNTSGFYFGNDGLAFGGGKTSLGRDGTFVAKSATLTGTIVAKSGRIGADSNGNGGFEIGTNYIKNGKSSYSDSNEGVYIGTSGIGLGAGTFYVQKNGNVYANNLTMTGKLGGAGGFTVESGKFYSGSKSSPTDSNYGVYVGTDGIALGTRFLVTTAGELTASLGTIGGWTIDRTKLYNPNGSNSSYPYCGMSSGTYSFYAGSDADGGSSNSYFSVTNDGAVTITKLYYWDQNASGGWDKIEFDFQKESKKLTSNYLTVDKEGSTSSTLKFSDGSTFNGAASVYVKGVWRGREFEASPKIMKGGVETDAGGASCTTTIRGIWDGTSYHCYCEEDNHTILKSGNVSVTIDYLGSDQGRYEAKAMVDGTEVGTMALDSELSGYEAWYDGWAAYWDSSYWQAPSASNGWECKVPNRNATGSVKWDACSYAPESHSYVGYFSCTSAVNTEGIVHYVLETDITGGSTLIGQGGAYYIYT